jgi:signal transduction histidine kinase/HAMP domain-containing protein
MDFRKLCYRAGLRTEIITVTTVIIILTTVVSSAFFYTKTKKSLFESLYERGKTISENLSRSAKYSMLTDDKQALDDIVAGATWSDDVAYVVITDNKANVLAEKALVSMPDTNEIQSLAIQTQQCQASFTTDSSGTPIYNFCYPVIARKVSLSELGGIESQIEEDTSVSFRGIVHVGLSLHNTITKLNDMLRGAIAITVAIIGCGVLLSTGLARFMMKPIEQMEQAASKVATGDLSQTVKVYSRDEIGRFAQQFNTMTTALKNREQQLQESYADLSASEERYRVFVQNSSESIWCFEPKNRNVYPSECSEDELIRHLLTGSVVVECNDAMAKIYQAKRREELLGATLSDFLSLEDHERIEHLRAFIRNGYERTDAERHYSDELNQIRTMITTLIGTTENGKLLRVWVIQRDITDIKRAEQLQMQLFAKVQETNQELREFAYVASHDLKAPLRGIKTLAEWLAKDYSDKLDDAGKEQLKLLTNRVDRMHNLIDGILQYSRVGRIQEKPVDVHLNDLVPEVVDIIAPPKNFEIVYENTLPIITFEETRIRQVFQNLISNAVKYMDKPKGIISIGCTDAQDFWKFNVSDNGPGIDEKYYEKIFKIFQTLKSRDEYESTGIGLTIVKKIVELYGGKIWVESEVGQGTTFFFTIKKTLEKQRTYENLQATAT